MKMPSNMPKSLKLSAAFAAMATLTTAAIGGFTHGGGHAFFEKVWEKDHSAVEPNHAVLDRQAQVIEAADESQIGNVQTVIDQSAPSTAEATQIVRTSGNGRILGNFIRQKLVTDRGGQPAEPREEHLEKTEFSWNR